MSVKEAIQMAAQKPFAELLLRMAHEAGFENQNQLAIAAWGVGKDGTARRSGHLSQILSGKSRVTDRSLTELAPFLKKDPKDLIALRDEMVPPIGTGTIITAPRGVEPAAKPKATHQPAPRPLLAAPPPELPQFSLVVAQSGLATLRLNLVDIPMRDAMRALSTLTAAGILNGDEEPPS